MLETRPVAASAGEVQAALKKFMGEIEQIPPMHSALKRDGVPLYKLARRGESVERRPRRVRILELELLDFKNPLLNIRVRCSKGTYVRTLAEDIGAALGCGAHLAGLRRTGSGRFRVDGRGPGGGAGDHGAARAPRPRSSAWTRCWSSCPASTSMPPWRRSCATASRCR